MISLYNIFESIILEETKLLSEGITIQDIQKAIDSNLRYKVWYQGEKETTPSMRLVDFYAFGTSLKDNDVVRVFQPFGFTTTQNGKWKLLRIDRITRMEPTGFRLSKKSIDKYSPDIPPFNQYGDGSMKNVKHIRKVE